MTNQAKTKVHNKQVQIPMAVYKAIVKEARTRTDKTKKRVYEHTIIIEALTEKFLPNNESLTNPSK